jgi:hypothetical protein
MQDVPGGPGVFARRDDLGNVKKIQREGRNISEASGGTYSERKDIKEIYQGAPTDVEQPVVGNPMAQSLVTQGAFEPGNPETPLSSGAKFGPGNDDSGLLPRVDDISSGELLARAMYLANPTPQLARIVDAYNEERRG